MNAPVPVSAFRHTLDEAGLLTLTLDVPDARVNALGRRVLEELRDLLGQLEAGPPVKAMVLRSGKPDGFGFIVGADIQELSGIRSALEGQTLSREVQAVLERVAVLPFPVVAAIHGPCLGAGLEVALACRYRVASDDPRTALGLPEVTLGLIPGAGGTQRLPRLIGLVAGLDLIATGRSLKARRALAAGLVDEVVPAPILDEVARRAALALAGGRRLPRRLGIRGHERLLRPVLFRRARKAVLDRTGGHYPAPLRAIEAVERGTAASLANGLAVEAELFGSLVVSPASRALVGRFQATQELKKDQAWPDGAAPREVHRLGLLGAGLMGAGIAAAAAEAGVAVRMKDTTREALGRGLREARRVFDERRGRGSLQAREVEARMDRIAPTLDLSGFRRADLVIEAVFEELELKRRVLAEAEAVVGERCVIATNTSSLPVAEIGRDLQGRGRVLGMHFFSPVHRMKLLEVVVTPETEGWATASAVGFGRRLDKHVIVVRDGPGFYTTRILAPYLNEAARLLEEGAAIEDVDEAARGFGFPVGPLTLLDEVGIDVGAKVSTILHHRLGPRLQPPAGLAPLLGDGRLGRKNGRGFYVYQGRKRVDPSLYALLPRGAPRRVHERRDVEERLVFALLNEAVWCLQDRVLRSPRDGDVGAVFGLGFPPFLGGPFRYLDHLGPRFAAEVLQRLEARHGDRFRPAPLLLEQASQARGFHG